jgi:RNA polymerase sigma factor (sigma-70 family)
MNHVHHSLFLRSDHYLREIRAGGPGADVAISSLYKKYRRRVVSAIGRLISSHPEYKGTAEDLVHDAFIIMIHKIQVESIQIRSLSGFWMGIGKNIFLNQLKKDERTVLVRDSEEMYGLNEETPEYLFLKTEEQQQMENTFSQLGSRCREILLLWINQYTMGEIAQQMNLTNAMMARKIKCECFKKLKKLVREGNKWPS